MPTKLGTMSTSILLSIVRQLTYDDERFSPTVAARDELPVTFPVGIILPDCFTNHRPILEFIPGTDCDFIEFHTTPLASL
jgi:hypothetical protein